MIEGRSLRSERVAGGRISGSVSMSKGHMQCESETGVRNKPEKANFNEDFNV